jgi:F-box-like
MTHLVLPVLPPEILDEILFLLDPLDVASFAQTCKKYYNFVYRPGDNHLWRGLYLAQPLDDPRCSLTPRLDRISPKDIDWKTSLQAFIRARTVLADPSKCRPGERETIFRTLIKVLRGATPASSFYEETRSENLVWLETMLRNGAFLTGELPGSTATELQLRAYLLVHLGLTPNDAKSESKASARAFVYDMRNYHYDNNFGPYMSDGSGRINWVHLYAIHRTIAKHLVDLQEGELFACPPIPISVPYCQSIIPSGLDLSKERDWAGIEGPWHCTFSFVDHRELLRKLFLPLCNDQPNPRRIEYLPGGYYRESTGS